MHLDCWKEKIADVKFHERKSELEISNNERKKQRKKKTTYLRLGRNENKLIHQSARQVHFKNTLWLLTEDIFVIFLQKSFYRLGQITLLIFSVHFINKVFKTSTSEFFEDSCGPFLKTADISLNVQSGHLRSFSLVNCKNTKETVNAANNR